MDRLRIELDKITSARIQHLAHALDTTVELLAHDLLQFALRARNQTEVKWLEGIDDQTLGTGVFLVPDVTKSEFGAVQKVVVPNLTWDDCIRRGEAAMAFKWVPHTVQSYEELMKST